MTVWISGVGCRIPYTILYYTALYHLGTGNGADWIGRHIHDMNGKLDRQMGEQKSVCLSNLSVDIVLFVLFCYSAVCLE